MTAPRRWLRLVWTWLRQVSGDAAYETYLAHACEPVLDRRGFYLDLLKRKYDSINRCC